MIAYIISPWHTIWPAILYSRTTAEEAIQTDATLKFEQQPSFLGRWQTQKPHWNRWEMLASDIRKSRSITLYCRLNSATVHHFGRAIPTHPPTKTKTNCRKKEKGQHKSKTVSLTLPNRRLLKTFLPSAALKSLFGSACGLSLTHNPKFIDSRKFQVQMLRVQIHL